MKVTMRLTYPFVDGSIDDETTTYRQQGTFRLVRNYHMQKGPFFAKLVHFAVEASTGLTTSRTTDQLDGYGPVVRSDLEGTGFRKQDVLQTQITKARCRSHTHIEDTLRISWLFSRASFAARGELVPAKAEVD